MYFTRWRLITGTIETYNAIKLLLAIKCKKEKAALAFSFFILVPQVSTQEIHTVKMQNRQISHIQINVIEKVMKTAKLTVTQRGQIINDYHNFYHL